MNHHQFNEKAANKLWLSGLIGMLLLTALPAQAASVSFYLDQSNKLPDDTNYLSVTLTENGSEGVDFLVQTLDPLDDVAGENFGIQKFGFNFTSNTLYEITGLPDHWKIKKDKRMSEFGRYDIRLQGGGDARTDELSFTVAGVDLDDFDSFFAAHVAGFEWCRIENENRCSGEECFESAYFAGSAAGVPVPVPAAAWLFGSALVGLLGVMRRKTSMAERSDEKAKD